MAQPAITRVQFRYYRYPVANPVISRVGRFAARQSLLVRVEAADGAYGWGEIWCNFPDCGGDHRMKLAAETIGPWLIDREFDDVPGVMAEAHQAFRILALQTAEPGPINQILAGVDCALWDLTARRRSEPVAVALGGDLRPLPAYASGINPADPVTEVEKGRAKGFKAFKLKIGFDKDKANLEAMLSFLNKGDRFAVDANQAWDFETASRMLDFMAEMPLEWVEEPMPADTDSDTLALLSSRAKRPLSGGENVIRREAFEALIQRKSYNVLQPDCAKWGGLSLCRHVAQKAIKSGLRYCPHYLGGGIGLYHSAHLLSAVGGDGLLEVDNNDNPLRDTMVTPLLPEADGMIHLKDAPGLGVEPDLAAINPWQAGAIDITRDGQA